MCGEVASFKERGGSHEESWLTKSFTELLEAGTKIVAASLESRGQPVEVFFCKGMR